MELGRRAPGNMSPVYQGLSPAFSRLLLPLSSSHITTAVSQADRSLCYEQYPHPATISTTLDRDLQLQGHSSRKSSAQESQHTPISQYKQHQDVHHRPSLPTTIKTILRAHRHPTTLLPQPLRLHSILYKTQPTLPLVLPLSLRHLDNEQHQQQIRESQGSVPLAVDAHESPLGQGESELRLKERQ